jgi:phytoene dehydrogenase-like protein
MDRDVVIVGAGLAGLCCALRLQQAGVSCRLFEASDRAGGRVATDFVDGFALDRGFQVLLTAYPEVQRWLDLDALDLRSFYSGALIRYDGAMHRVANPLREPLAIPQTLFSPIGTLSDKLRVVRLRQKLTSGSLGDLFERPEISTYDALCDRYGFSDEMIDRFFRPFLGGILLDTALVTSSRAFEFYFRMFATGQTAVPARGMCAIPEQLAARLASGTLRLNAPVAAVKPGGIRVEGGEIVNARAVVVATDGPEAAYLTERFEPPVSRSVTCIYFAADRSPVDEPILVLDGDREGPVNNLVVISEVAPEYAPEGQSLISASVIGNPERSDADLEKAVRAHLKGWFGRSVADWRRLKTYRILHAQPDQEPPALDPPERSCRLEEGLYVCGDHRQTASLHGAMRSGRRAAEAVLRDLAIGLAD